MTKELKPNKLKHLIKVSELNDNSRPSLKNIKFDSGYVYAVSNTTIIRYRTNLSINTIVNPSTLTTYEATSYPNVEKLLRFTGDALFEIDAQYTLPLLVKTIRATDNIIISFSGKEISFDNGNEVIAVVPSNIVHDDIVVYGKYLRIGLAAAKDMQITPIFEIKNVHEPLLIRDNDDEFRFVLAPIRKQ